MKRTLMLISAVMVLAIIGAAGAAFLMSDSDIEDALKSLPGTDSHSSRVVDAKHSVSSGVANWFDDQLYAITSTWRDVIGYSPGNRTPRVVIELEPIRDRVKKMAPTSKPGMAAPEPTVAAPVKLMPASPASPAPEPAPEVTAAPTPEKMEPAKAEHSPEPEPAHKAPEPAPAPEPEPAKKVEKVAAIAKKAEPAPPPAAPKSDNGAAAHKKGLAFYKGVGEEKNFKTAKTWFEKAAKKGHAAAQYNLGIMSYLGQGTEQDYLRASEWFRMAAEQEHALAQYNLGFLYYGGKGVEKDDLQAFMWIDRAAGLGDEKAIKARDTLAKILPKEIFKKK